MLNRILQLSMWELTSTPFLLPFTTLGMQVYTVEIQYVDISIVYSATTKNLSVSWSYQRTSNSQENTSLSYPVDLSKVLPE